jgi:hypothetical protein
MVPEHLTKAFQWLKEAGKKEKQVGGYLSNSI